MGLLSLLRSKLGSKQKDPPKDEKVKGWVNPLFLHRERLAELAATNGYLLSWQVLSWAEERCMGAAHLVLTPQCTPQDVPPCTPAEMPSRIAKFLNWTDALEIFPVEEIPGVLTKYAVYCGNELFVVRIYQVYKAQPVIPVSSVEPVRPTAVPDAVAPTLVVPKVPESESESISDEEGDNGVVKDTFKTRRAFVRAFLYDRHFTYRSIIAQAYSEFTGLSLSVSRQCMTRICAKMCEKGILQEGTTPNRFIRTDNKQAMSKHKKLVARKEAVDSVEQQSLFKEPKKREVPAEAILTMKGTPVAPVPGVTEASSGPVTPVTSVTSVSTIPVAPAAPVLGTFTPPGAYVPDLNKKTKKQIAQQAAAFAENSPI